MVKRITAFLMVGVLVPAAAQAKAYFAPKGDMISNAVVIAVTDIS